jgi:hypothetical protein
MLSVSTFPHVTASQLAKGDHLGLTKLFLGESPEITLMSGQIKYFYFENWANSSLKFSYHSSRAMTAPTSVSEKIELELLPWYSRQLPTNVMNLLGAKWHDNVASTRMAPGFSNLKMYSHQIRVSSRTKDFDFCVQCFFILRI